MRNLLGPWIFDDLPLIPMWVYKALIRVCGKYPEQSLLRISTFLGQPQTRRSSRLSQHWVAYEPYRTSASICDLTATWLWKCLERSQSRFIIEFGTGFSTLVMLSYAQDKLQRSGQRVEILSIEHDRFWYESQRNTLLKLDVSRQVHLVLSRIETMMCLGQQVRCYSGIEDTIIELGLNQKADFIFVDGPVGLQYGGTGRKGAILQSISLAAEEATILIHDALRKDEFATIQELNRKKAEGIASLGIVPLWYGLAKLKRNHI